MIVEPFFFGGHMHEGCYSLPVRVYYEDTDAGGILYHASTVRFFERGRTEYIRSLGLIQSSLMSDTAKLSFVVRRLEVDYVKPARLDDVLVIETRLTDRRKTSCTFEQKLMCASSPLILYAIAKVVCVAINGEGRPCALPDRL